MFAALSTVFVTSSQIFRRLKSAKITLLYISDDLGLLLLNFQLH